MRRIAAAVTIGWTLASAAGAGPAAAAGPAIAGYGRTSDVPGAANLPDPSLSYRVIFSLAAGSGGPARASPALDKVARFLNLLAGAGVHPAKGDVLVVVYGAATPMVLTDAAYRARFGTANPNLPLIRALAGAGVAVHACGQALHAQGIAAPAVAPEVTVDLSAMTTIATLQLRGWVLMPG